MSDLPVLLEVVRTAALMAVLLVGMVLVRRDRDRTVEPGIPGWTSPSARIAPIEGPREARRPSSSAAERRRVALAVAAAAAFATVGFVTIMVALDAGPIWWTAGIVTIAGVARLVWRDATRLPGGRRARPMPVPAETPEMTRIRWRERFIRTERADRQAAEAALIWIGRELDTPAAPIVWVRSPLEAELARHIIEAVASAPIVTEGRRLQPVVLGQLPLLPHEATSAGPPSLSMYWAVPAPHAGVPEAAWTELVASLRAQLPEGPRQGPALSRRDVIARLDRDHSFGYTMSAPVASTFRASASLTNVELAAARRACHDGLARPAPEPGLLGGLIWLEHFGRIDHSAVGRALRALVDAGAEWWPSQKIGCHILVDRPDEIHLDDELRPHRLDGPAIRYRDGFEVFAIEGHEAPSYAIGDPSLITVDRIQAEPDVVVRGYMRERYGTERYRQELMGDPARLAAEPDVAMARSLVETLGLERFCQGAGRVAASDIDMAGEPRRLWRVHRRNDQELVVVEVANSTPEPDGTRRRYWLRVPPHVGNCRDAVAWTFGLLGAQYTVAVET